MKVVQVLAAVVLLCCSPIIRCAVKVREAFSPSAHTRASHASSNGLSKAGVFEKIGERPPLALHGVSHVVLPGVPTSLRIILEFERHGLGKASRQYNRRGSNRCGAGAASFAPLGVERDRRRASSTAYRRRAAPSAAALGGRHFGLSYDVLEVVDHRAVGDERPARRRGDCREELFASGLAYVCHTARRTIDIEWTSQASMLGQMWSMGMRLRFVQASKA